MNSIIRFDIFSGFHSSLLLLLFVTPAVSPHPPAAVAQRVQPGQRLCGADPDGGARQASHGRPGPQAPLDHQHGGLLVHEEPAALHLPEPPEEGVVALPQHQVGPVHALQPLHQVQQSQAGAREGAARAEPPLSAAVQRLRRRARRLVKRNPSLVYRGAARLDASFGGESVSKCQIRVFFFLRRLVTRSS